MNIESQQQKTKYWALKGIWTNSEYDQRLIELIPPIRKRRQIVEIEMKCTKCGERIVRVNITYKMLCYTCKIEDMRVYNKLYREKTRK